MDEVGHTDVTVLVNDLLQRQREADEKLRTDAHAAVKDAVLWAAYSIAHLSHMADGSPSRVTHGAALVSLAQAFEDRDRGIHNPLLQPLEGRGGNNLRQEIIYARVNVVVAVELVRRAGRRKGKAQKEVAELLGRDHRIFAGHRGERWRLVKQWGEDIASGDYPDAAEKFDGMLEAALTTIQTRVAEPSAEDLVKAARAALGELDRYA
jgi:hypothetical protein